MLTMNEYPLVDEKQVIICVQFHGHNPIPCITLIRATSYPTQTVWYTFNNGCLNNTFFV